MKRSRRGGRRPQHGSHNQGGGGNGGGFNPNRTYDSTGPEVKIRGSASHIYEKYLQLARDANTAGDRVMAENYLQHAEHYYRILAQQQQQMQQYQQQQQREAQYQANAAASGRAAQPQAENTSGAGNGSSTPSFDLNEGDASAVRESAAGLAEETVPENEGF